MATTLCPPPIDGHSRISVGGLTYANRRHIVATLRNIASFDGLTYWDLRHDTPEGDTLRDLLHDVDRGEVIVMWGCFSQAQLDTRIDRNPNR